MQNVDNDALSIMIELEPQLGLACKRFWHILERQSRAKVLKTLGNSPLIDKLKSDTQRLLGFDTWGAVAYLCRMDIWFFSPQHIVDLQDTDLSDAESADDQTDLINGVWRHVHGLRWGESLHASNVKNLHLRYETKLRPGRYKICINLRVGNFVKLYPIRFQVKSSAVTQLGSVYPTVHLDTSNNHPDSMYEHNQYLQFRPCELCIGLMDVHGDASSPSWPHITFEIEDSGRFVNRGILFNYLFFEKVPDDTRPKDFWALDRKTFWPTTEWVQLYNNFNENKFIYC